MRGNKTRDNTGIGVLRGTYWLISFFLCSKINVQFIQHFYFFYHTNEDNEAQGQSVKRKTKFVQMLKNTKLNISHNNKGMMEENYESLRLVPQH